MRRLGRLGLLAGLVLIGSMAMAGDHFVTGPVSGDWDPGTRVFVSGRAWVPAGGVLTVHEGVFVIFDSPHKFDVFGRIKIDGTETGPVVLTVPDEWEGIELHPSHETSSFTHVIVDRNGGIPQRVIVSNNARLRVHECDLIALESCLFVTEGRLRVTHSNFFTILPLSKAVRIHSLEDPQVPCDEDYDEQANVFHHNFIKAVYLGSGFTGYPGQFAAGLYLDGSASLCIYENDVTLEGMPWTAVGAYFGSHDAGSDAPSWNVHNCTFTVRAMDALTEGIRNNDEGTLNLIDVNISSENLDPGSVWPAHGVSAHNSAVITAGNAAAVTAGPGPNRAWIGLGGGQITVDYSLRWNVFTGDEGSVPNGGPTEGSGGASIIGSTHSLDTERVFEGLHVITDQAPLYVAEGELGAWTCPEEVEAYYSLRYESPCRNAGDPYNTAWDPDNTVPDIGRFNYDHNTSDASGPGSIPVVSAMSLAAAYPNPFNPSTVLPFELARSGAVHVVVYDVQGRTVATLVNRTLPPGSHTVSFGALDYPSGTYLVRVQFDGSTVGIQRVVLLK